MEVVAQIIAAIAWPAAIIWVAYLFRREVRSLFGRVSSLKYNELEAKFERNLEEAKEKVKLLKADQRAEWDKGTLQAVSTTYELFQRIAEISPRAAIVEYWMDLEAAVAAAARTAGIESKSPFNSRELVKQFIALKKMTDDVLPAYDQLRELRNQAVHLQDFSLSLKDAHSYLQSVLGLGNEFRSYAVGGA